VSPEGEPIARVEVLAWAAVDAPEDPWPAEPGHVRSLAARPGSPSARTVSGPQGEFSFDVLPAPVVELGVGDPWSEESPVRATAGARDVSLVAVSSARVRLRVDGPRGAPVELDLVEEVSGRHMIMTTSHGSHLLPYDDESPEAPGRYTLMARTPGHAPAVLRFEVRTGERIEPEPVKLARGGGARELRVRWPDAPIWGFRAKWRDPSTGVEASMWLDPPTRPDVPLRIDPVGAGTTTIRLIVRTFDDPSRRELVLPATIHEGATTTVDVDLR
jgi:hypothetical protein